MDPVELLEQKELQSIGRPYSDIQNRNTSWDVSTSVLRPSLVGGVPGSGIFSDPKPEHAKPQALSTEPETFNTIYTPRKTLQKTQPHPSNIIIIH